MSSRTVAIASLAAVLGVGAACSGGSGESSNPELSNTETSDDAASGSTQPSETPDVGSQPDSAPDASDPDPAADAGPATDLAPVSAQLIADAPSELFYDVSPDGAWLSTLPSANELCLAPVASPTDEMCRDLGDRHGNQVRWSPDATRVVVVPDTARLLIAEPMIVVDLDGEITEIASRPNPDDIDGAVLDAAFVDNDTLMYSAIVGTGGPAAQFWSIDVDGANHTLLGEFGPVGDEPAPLPYSGLLPLDETTALVPQGRLPIDAGLSLFDLDAGVVEQLLPGGRELRPSNPVPLQDRGGMILIVDFSRLASYGFESSEVGFYWLLVDGELIGVPDRGVYRTQSAALSPDGEHIAILEVYVGETVDGEPDDAEEPPERGSIRVSVTTVASLLDGDPLWFDIADVSEEGRSADRDGLESAMVWTEPDRLWLELRDGLFEVTLEPAG